MERVLRLPDGRRLGLTEYGDADGAPVFMFHGLPGSRLQFHPNPAVARGSGVRVLALDRPGLGLSDPQPRRAILDWPRDVAAAADALELERFGILALSGGGPYGAACAARLAPRLASVTLVSPLGPLDEPGALAGMAPLLRWYLRLARRAPALLPLVSYPFLLIRRFPLLIRLGRPYGGISRHDQAVMRREPELTAMFRRDFAEATRRGIGGLMWEAHLAAAPWGFAPQAIEAPITVWYGDRDAMTPRPMVERLIAALPRCRPHFVPGEGHFLFFHYLKEILKDTLGGPHSKSE